MTPIQRGLLFAGLSCVAAALAGCSDPIDRAYDDCMERVEAGIAEAERELGGDNAAAMGAFARTAGESGCRAMRDACRADPDSPMCKAALDSFNE